MGSKSKSTSTALVLQPSQLRTGRQMRTSQFYKWITFWSQLTSHEPLLPWTFLYQYASFFPQEKSPILRANRAFQPAILVLVGLFLWQDVHFNVYSRLMCACVSTQLQACEHMMDILIISRQLFNPTVLWEIKETMDVVILVMVWVCDSKYRVPMHLFWNFSIFENLRISKQISDLPNQQKPN